MRFKTNIVKIGLVICLSFLSHETNARPKSAFNIDIKTQEITNFSIKDPKDKKAGKLEFINGLIISSENEHFGGFSGLHLSSDMSKITAISDKGYWLHANVTRQGSILTNIENAVMAPMLDKAGNPFKKKSRADAEGLAIKDKTAFVSFERNHRVLSYKLDKEGFAGKSQGKVFNFKKKQMSRNSGVEALAIGPDNSRLSGRLIAFPENKKTGKRKKAGFIIQSKKKSSKIKIVSPKGYRITGADFLPNGDLLVLERLLDLPANLRMRIQRIPAEQFENGDTLEGTELINVDLNHQIDNIEGISANINNKGETIISVISDDNFNAFQKTIYLEFKLTE